MLGNPDSLNVCYLQNDSAPLIIERTVNNPNPTRSQIKKCYQQFKFIKHFARNSDPAIWLMHLLEHFPPTESIYHNELSKVDDIGHYLLTLVQKQQRSFHFDEIACFTKMVANKVNTNYQSGMYHVQNTYDWLNYLNVLLNCQYTLLDHRFWNYICENLPIYIQYEIIKMVTPSYETVVNIINKMHTSRMLLHMLVPYPHINQVTSCKSQQFKIALLSSNTAFINELFANNFIPKQEDMTMCLDLLSGAPIHPDKIIRSCLLVVLQAYNHKYQFTPSDLDKLVEIFAFNDSYYFERCRRTLEYIIMTSCISVHYYPHRIQPNNHLIEMYCLKGDLKTVIQRHYDEAALTSDCLYNACVGKVKRQSKSELIAYLLNNDVLITDEIKSIPGINMLIDDIGNRRLCKRCRLN